jgi:hypothetical protein
MAIWSHQELAELAQFDDARTLSKEMARYDLAIHSIGESFRIKACRYSDIAAAKALILGKLRSVGLSVSRAAALLRRIKNEELAFALDAIDPDRTWIAFPMAERRKEYALGVNRIELGELLDRCGGAAIVIDLRGVQVQ